MTSPQIPPHVREAVTRCVVDSLAVAPEAVTLQSRLIDDLGADSLDFVDLVFAIGQELGIQVRDSEFNFLVRLDFSSPEVMQGGALVAPVVARLAEWLPGLRELPPGAPVTPRQMFSLLTVEAICVAAARSLPAPA